jgi:hypothetical protein
MAELGLILPLVIVKEIDFEDAKEHETCLLSVPNVSVALT